MKSKKQLIMPVFMLTIASILILICVSFFMNKGFTDAQKAEEKPKLNDIGNALKNINDDIKLDDKDKTIYEVYLDDKEEVEDYNADFDDTGIPEHSDFLGVKANGKNVKIDVSDAHDYDEYGLEAYGFHDNVLAYQIGNKIIGKNLLTGEQTELLKVKKNIHYVEDISISDEYTLISGLEEGEAEYEDYEVLCLYNNKSGEEKIIYKEDELDAFDLLSMCIYGDNVYYNEFSMDDSIDQSPLDQYDIPNDKTTELFKNADFVDTYGSKILFYLEGSKGGIFNTEKNRIENKFELPGYFDMIPWLTLYKEQIIYYDGETAELKGYNYKEKSTDVLYKFPVKMKSDGYIEGTKYGYLSHNRAIKLNDYIRLDISLMADHMTKNYPGHQGEEMQVPYYIEHYQFIFDPQSGKMKYISY